MCRNSWILQCNLNDDELFTLKSKHVIKEKKINEMYVDGYKKSFFVRCLLLNGGSSYDPSLTLNLGY